MFVIWMLEAALFMFFLRTIPTTGFIQQAEPYDNAKPLRTCSLHMSLAQLLSLHGLIMRRNFSTGSLDWRKSSHVSAF